MDEIDYDSPIGINKYKIEDLNNALSSEGWYGLIEDKPQIEQDLFKLQNDFFYAEEHNKHKIWSEMFIIVKKYAKSLIQKRLKNRIFIEPEEVEEKASTCALNFMSQYTERPGFHVGASFAGTINPKVVEVLYKQIPEDKNIQLNSIMIDSSEESEPLERMSLKSIFSNQETDFTDIKESLREVISSTIKDYDNTNVSSKQKILIRLWILLLLKRPKNKHVKNCFRKNWCDFKMLKIIDLFEIELYRRLTNEGE